jgi:hypothetical protein
MTDLLEERIHAVVSSTEAAPDVDAVLDGVLDRAARIRRARRIRTTAVAGAVAAVIAIPLLVAVDVADDPGSGSGSLEVASSSASGLDVPATDVPATDSGATASTAVTTTASTVAVADAEFRPSLVADPSAQFEIPDDLGHVVGDPVFYRVVGTDEAVAILSTRDLRSDDPTAVHDRCTIHALDPRAMVCRAEDPWGNPDANASSSFQLRPGLFGQFVADDVVGVELVDPDGTVHRAGAVGGVVLFALEPQPGQFVIRHIASDGNVVEDATYALFPEA